MIPAFIDKVLICVLGMFITLVGYEDENIIGYLLYGVIILGIVQCLYENQYIHMEGLTYVALTVICSFYPELIGYVGMCVYSMVYKYDRKKIEIKIYGVFILIISIYPFICLSAYQRSLHIVIVIVSVLIAKKAKIIEVNNLKIKKQRDDSIEIEQALKDKNVYLLQNRENEIHIATLNERNRIAREIHDNVGHMLSRSILQLGAIITIEKNEATKMMLIPLKNTLDEAMNSIRDSVHDLHKDSFDLRENARKVLAELETYEVNLECDISIGADKEVKYCFATILKEAVTNIVKHSNADKVDVTIRELDNYYQMVVEDNGEVQKSINGVNAGIGLSNMQERVKALFGVISFSTNKGFRIFISIPKEKR